MFMVLLDGGGGGCDYTIGCNKKWKKLKATTKEEANVEVAIIVKEYGRRETQIDTATIIQVTSAVEFDVDGLWEAIDTAKAKRDAEKKLAEDKAKYEELKKKFEG